MIESGAVFEIADGELDHGVVTMEPGEAFWERFGHDAIVVDEALTSGRFLPGATVGFGIIKDPSFNLVNFTIAPFAVRIKAASAIMDTTNPALRDELVQRYRLDHDGLRMRAGAAFPRLSLDLIYARPGQAPGDWRG